MQDITNKNIEDDSNHSQTEKVISDWKPPAPKVSTEVLIESKRDEVCKTVSRLFCYYSYRIYCSTFTLTTTLIVVN